MFDHVTTRSSDRAASEHFYALVLATLGIGPACEHYTQWADFSLAGATRAS